MRCVTPHSHPFKARFTKYVSFEYLSEFLYMPATLSQLDLATMAKEKRDTQSKPCSVGKFPNTFLRATEGLITSTSNSFIAQ